MPWQLGTDLPGGQVAAHQAAHQRGDGIGSPPSCTALTSPLRRDVARVAHHSAAATVSYGSGLMPLAGGSHVPADTWVSISASRASVVTAWAAWRASSAAAASSVDGLASSRAHDAHVAITHAATSAAGSAWGGPGHRDRHLPAPVGLVMG